MYVQDDITKIKTSLSDNVGHKVRLTAKKGRKQTVTREGVIESIYPSIFTIKLDNKNDYLASERRVSYSYADVLTKSVELVIYAPENEGGDTSEPETVIGNLGDSKTADIEAQAADEGDYDSDELFHQIQAIFNIPDMDDDDEADARDGE